MNKEKNQLIYELWKIIDDIDTASDVAKDDDKKYRELVEQLQKKRWEVVEDEAFLDELYRLYHK